MRQKAKPMLLFPTNPSRKTQRENLPIETLKKELPWRGCRHATVDNQVLAVITLWSTVDFSSIFEARSKMHDILIQSSQHSINILHITIFVKLTLRLCCNNKIIVIHQFCDVRIHESRSFQPPKEFLRTILPSLGVWHNYTIHTGSR
jgi:hypothetical protein